MNLSYFSKHFSVVKRLAAAAMLCLSVTALTWQGGFVSNATAIANPSTNLIAADLGNKVKDKVSEDTNRAKNFVQDTADKVERTAKRNASKVDDATDSGSILERKAKNDKNRILDKAEKDSARTQDAIDDTKNVVERTVDSIKDAFRG
jgi:Skp family chaperone for outer membrane proteins